MGDKLKCNVKGFEGRWVNSKIERGIEWLKERDRKIYTGRETDRNWDREKEM